VDALLQPLTDPYLQRALVAGVLVAAGAAAVGTFVVLRGLAFIGDALAHGVLPGIAVALIAGAPGMAGALVGAAAMIGGVTLVTRATRLSGDTAIGLLFVGMLALGVVIVSRSDTFTGDLTRILFGDVLGIAWADVWTQAAVTAAVLVATLLCARPFLLLSMDPETATVAGFPAGRYHALMLALIAVTVVVSFQAVGTLLVFGMIVAPPATAALLSRRVGATMALAAAIGAASVWLGLAASYRWDLAAGASVVLVQIAVFFAVLAGVGLRRALAAPAGVPA
jgi:ABC-type Mn2+/Zn2+ transport system permease subunit